MSDEERKTLEAAQRILLYGIGMPNISDTIIEAITILVQKALDE